MNKVLKHVSIVCNLPYFLSPVPSRRVTILLLWGVVCVSGAPRAMRGGGDSKSRPVGITTLLWWDGVRVCATPKAMPLGFLLPLESTMSERSKGRGQTK